MATCTIWFANHIALIARCVAYEKWMESGKCMFKIPLLYIKNHQTPLSL